MGTPVDHLQKTIYENAVSILLLGIGLPKATRIFSPRVTAQDDSIYVMKLPPSNRSGRTYLVALLSSTLPVQRRRISVWI